MVRKKLISALAVIALMAQFTGCNGNIPAEKLFVGGFCK